LTFENKEETDEQALKRKVSLYMSTPMDMQRPLWDLTIIEGLRNGGSVLFWRIHHCICDGQGAVHLFLSLIEHTTGNRPEQSHIRVIHERDHCSPKKRKPIKDIALDIVTRIFYFIYGILNLIFNLFYVAFFYNKETFVGEFSVEKQVGWSEPIKLSDVKRVKEYFGVTVNDVMLTALGATFRRYMAQLAPQRIENEVLVGIPVSMRPFDDFTLSNQTVISNLWLPTFSENPIELIKRVHKRTKQMKISPEPNIQKFSLKQMRYLPPTPITWVLKWFMRKVTAVITNVPGPADKLEFAGCQIESFIPLIPLPGPGGLGVAILSYGGEVMVTINCDKNVIEGGIEQITNLFVETFNDMLSAVKANCLYSVASESNSETKKND